MVLWFRGSATLRSYGAMVCTGRSSYSRPVPPVLSDSFPASMRFSMSAVGLCLRGYDRDMCQSAPPMKACSRYGLDDLPPVFLGTRTQWSRGGLHAAVVRPSGSACKASRIVPATCLPCQERGNPSYLNGLSVLQPRCGEGMVRRYTGQGDGVGAGAFLGTLAIQIAPKHHVTFQ